MARTSSSSDTRNNPPTGAPLASNRCAATCNIGPMSNQATTNSPVSRTDTAGYFRDRVVSVLTWNSGPWGAPAPSYLWPRIAKGGVGKGSAALPQTTTKPPAAGAATAGWLVTPGVVLTLNCGPRGAP